MDLPPSPMTVDPRPCEPTSFATALTSSPFPTMSTFTFLVPWCSLTSLKADPAAAIPWMQVSSMSIGPVQHPAVNTPFSSSDLKNPYWSLGIFSMFAIEAELGSLSMPTERTTRSNSSSATSSSGAVNLTRGRPFSETVISDGLERIRWTPCSLDAHLTSSPGSRSQGLQSM